MAQYWFGLGGKLQLPELNTTMKIFLLNLKIKTFLGKTLIGNQKLSGINLQRNFSQTNINEAQKIYQKI